MKKNITKLWRKLRSHEYRWIWCLMAVLLYFIVLTLPIPELDFKAKQTLGVFVVTAFLWSTNTLPLAVTGLVVLFLIPFLGILSPEDTYRYFGNRAVFFVLGAFILASPIMRSGLSTRLALAVVSRFGFSQKALITSILGLSYLDGICY